MPSSFDVSQQELVREVANSLKQLKELTPPKWADFVKTGVHKERPPTDPDWWYARSASVLRKINVFGPIGTSKLRRFYGGRKNRGVAPERSYKGSGSIVRKVLQQLEKAGLAIQVEKDGHKGRMVTPKGLSLLDSSAQKILARSQKASLIPEVTFIETQKEEKSDKAKKEKKPKKEVKSEPEKEHPSQPVQKPEQVQTPEVVPSS